MSGSNPKFLNVEKKVVYNIRLPQRLIDKYNSYSELTGNTTTNIVTNVLSDFIDDKVVMNDYLDNTGGVTVKIPYAINQKNYSISNNINLMDYESKDEYLRITSQGRIIETYFAELFEVKKIPNNLDIYIDDSYVANKKHLLFNNNTTHSGIELFIYNITEIIFADAELINDFDSFINCLYCLYFEVSADESVNVYLIDYLTAINLLSASGNDEYKDLIIAAATELNKIDDIVSEYLYKKDNTISEFIDELNNIPDLELLELYKDGAKSDKIDELTEKHSPEIESAIKKMYIKRCDDEVKAICDKYNSNNIIIFGSDIFSRLAVKDIKGAPTGFLDEIVDELVDEKFEISINERLDEIIDEKVKRLEKENAELKSRLDKLDRLEITLQ